MEFIKAMIRREIDVDLFGVATAYQNLAKRDPQLQFALTLFPEAQQLLELSRQSTPATARHGRELPTPRKRELSDRNQVGTGVAPARRFGPHPKILWCHFGLATRARPC